MPVSIGLGLFTGQVPPGAARSFGDEYRDMLELARLGEAAGFGSLWVSEHHGTADGYLPSLTVALAAMAAVTRRARLGMGVALAPFQHPLRFAEDCAVTDQLSGGRLIVGLGLGWREEEFRAFGVPVGERVSRTTELVEICRRAWSEERFSHHGRHFDLEQVAVTPGPAHPLRILLGGTIPAAVARAGRLGDGFLSSQWAARPGAFLDRVRTFDASARSAGRDPAGMLLVSFLNVFVSEDGELPEDVASGVAHQVGAYAAWRQPTDVPGVRFVPAPPDRARIGDWLVSGTPDAVAERLCEWTSALAHRRFVLVVRLHYPGMSLDRSAAAIELFAARVLPQLGLEAGAVPDA